MSNVAEAVLQTARERPDAPAVRIGDAIISYSALQAAVSRLAGRLRAEGVEPGERVAIMLGNVAEFAVCYYAVLRSGAVVVPLNPLTRGEKLADQLGDCRPRVVLAAADPSASLQERVDEASARLLPVGPELLERREAGAVVEVDAEPVARADTDTAALLYGTGSSGALGVELSHGNLSWSASVAASTVLRVAAGQAVLCCFPLFHVFGQTFGLNAALSTGACLALLPRFDPTEALHTLRRRDAAALAGFPMLLERLLHQRLGASPLPGLHSTISIGGKGLAPRAKRRLASGLGCEVLEGYGGPETAGLACFTRPGAEPKQRSVGPAVEGVDVLVADHRAREMPDRKVGELLVRGPNVMKGYWRRPDETARTFRDGWLVTGDGARRDQDGEHYIVDGGWTDMMPGRGAGRASLLGGIRRRVSRRG